MELLRCRDSVPWRTRALKDSTAQVLAQARMFGVVERFRQSYYRQQ